VTERQVTHWVAGVCEHCGGELIANGTTVTCSGCGHAVEIGIPCEVYSRIVGYLRPVQNWNVAKQQEFEDRKTFEAALDDT